MDRANHARISRIERVASCCIPLQFAAVRCCNPVLCRVATCYSEKSGLSICVSGADLACALAKFGQGIFLLREKNSVIFMRLHR